MALPTAQSITSADLMLATKHPGPFSAEGWIFELKYDGYRLLVVREQGCVRMLSRSGKSLEDSFPEVREALNEQLVHDCVLDAELTVCDEGGCPSFERLQSRAATRHKLKVPAAARRDPAIVYAFDILSWRDADLRGETLVERKRWLREAFVDSKRLVYASGIHTAGDWVYSKVQELGVEGMVAKRLDSRYTAGYSRNWLKVKSPTYYRRAALGVRHR